MTLASKTCSLGFAVWCLCALAPIAEASLWITELQGGFPRSRLPAPSLPYPDSLQPEQVLENIKALASQPSMIRSSGISELQKPDGNLRVQRVLDVSAPSLSPSRYLVAELVSSTGRPIANVAMTIDGFVMNIQDLRTLAIGTIPRSADIAAARNRVSGGLKRAPRGARYVYFHNAVEGGVSFCRPLVEIEVDTGMFYVNSAGEVFAEAGTPLASEYLKTAVTKPSRSERESSRDLRPILQR